MRVLLSRNISTHGPRRLENHKTVPAVPDSNLGRKPINLAKSQLSADSRAPHSEGRGAYGGVYFGSLTSNGTR